MIYTHQKIFSCNQAKMFRDVVRMRAGENRIVCGILITKIEGKEALGRPRLVGENNIKMDIKEKGGRAWPGVTEPRIGAGVGIL